MKKITFLTFLVLAIFLSIIDRNGLLNPVRGIFQEITIPIQLGFYKTFGAIKDKLSLFGEIGLLRDKNSQLLEENLDLKTQVARSQKIQEENQLLKEQLGMRDEGFSANEDLKIADIIGFSPLGTQSRLILNKGQRDGVKVGDLAVIKNNLVGKIVLTTEKSATLQLLTDPDLKIPVQTVGGAKGLLVGQFGSEMRLTKVLQQEKIEKDELVLTLPDSGLPKNLVVGKVFLVLKDDKEIFQEAKINYLLPINKLNQVFLLSL